MINRSVSLKWVMAQRMDMLLFSRIVSSWRTGAKDNFSARGGRMHVDVQVATRIVELLWRNDSIIFNAGSENAGELRGIT